MNLKRRMRRAYFPGLSPNSLVHPRLWQLIDNEHLFFESWIKDWQYIDQRYYKTFSVPNAIDLGKLKLWTQHLLVHNGKVNNENPFVIG